ncbi:MAG TPA: acyl carrier protein [Luteolibacter sp.]|nr:acyl carrier protein [Luteolibacter sp.]
MNRSESLSPSPTELIDWMNDEGLLELDWDFPENGDLYEAGLEESALADLLSAVEEEYGVEISVADFKRLKKPSPAALAKLIATKGN